MELKSIVLYAVLTAGAALIIFLGFEEIDFPANTEHTKLYSVALGGLIANVLASWK